MPVVVWGRRVRKKKIRVSTAMPEVKPASTTKPLLIKSTEVKKVSLTHLTGIRNTHKSTTLDQIINEVNFS